MCKTYRAKKLKVEILFYKMKLYSAVANVSEQLHQGIKI